MPSPFQNRGLPAMYAVIKTGGKQYRVAAGDVVRIEKIPGDVGTTVTFEEVLLVGGDAAPRIGKPLVTGAKVLGTITAQDKHPRVLHFRKEKEGWTRRRGHRQPFTEVKVTQVAG
jgi:large subunit ribosomal protein L21